MSSSSEAEADLRGPLDVTRAATAVLDAQGVVMGWSPAAEELLGYTASEVLGRRLDTLLARPEDMRWPPRRGKPRTVRSEAFEVRHRDGHILRLAMIMSVLSAGGTGPTWIIVAADLEELQRWEAHQAMLRGLVTQSPITLTIYDTDLRLAWTNAASQEELGAPVADYVGWPESKLFTEGEVLTEGYPASLERVMRRVLVTGEPVVGLHYRGRPPADRRHDYFWSCSYYRLQDARGHTLGVCEEAVDISNQYQAQQRLALLVRAGERIGTSLDVRRTAEELADVVIPVFADAVAIDLLEDVLGGEEVAAGAAPVHDRMRRAGHRARTESAAVVVGPDPGEPVHYPPTSAQARSLASGQPILEHRAEAAADAGQGGVHSRLVVPLRAGGATMGLVTFLRDRNPDPFDADERSLADELAARTAICVDNACRFSREHAAALMLQRSLLPRGLPPQTAADVSYRYLPADTQAGVGGDWFDLIPLSGTRVGLVVGDVVGHGLRAAATMGRFRTTVRALARLDLAPDELLSRLDDLVGQTAKERSALWDGEISEAEPEDEEAMGVTCLYAVYDPVSGRCTVARAGHLLPLVVDPRTGAVIYPEIPPGPPLGLGGLPFESAEFDLPEGSLIALFTNGLVQSPDGDMEAGLQRLGAIIAEHWRPLDELCEHAVASRPAGPVADDAALLLVRTRVLAGHQVAEWELTADPAVVSQARTAAVEQLGAWGLGELAFTTELVVSELVTNAIRYAGGPIHLRLIRDQTLICEVSDTGHTSPHLRRAASEDEGGRGLFLIAQMTQLWGTRYTPTGKTIWAEQPLPHQHLDLGYAA
ncbi:SpoIIE family protein phosphatase [Streptomyces gobiensis]|uniref:SpoIIE family protein phosphatase n=1 Tax=Streptomyces gobiensis TaxID=2875706 RepID=UPI001E439FC7|nr:SpoIIE family protein phosphatase [Streptomyces gobiensis]UGY92949.1 SpoIIE family protein phosphatase [Streptomyces gobiensis]